MLENNMDFIDLFEKKLCDFTGANYAICTDCCTNAILLSLFMKHKLGEISKTIEIPSRTYISVPMTLKLFGFDVKLTPIQWSKTYEITSEGKTTGVIDSAVHFTEGMFPKFGKDCRNTLVCLSFQQKKRLNLGRGGAILTNNEDYYHILKRLVHDGRNPKIEYRTEVENNPFNITVGFHMYMEPEKAAKGVMILNQKQLLPPYYPINYMSYPNLEGII